MKKVFFATALLIMGAVTAVVLTSSNNSLGSTSTYSPTSSPTPSATHSVHPSAPIHSVPRCAEDDPCWDCHTMGNRICGTNPADHYAVCDQTITAGPGACRTQFVQIASITRTYPCSSFRTSFFRWVCRSNIAAGYRWKPLSGGWRKALHGDYPHRNFKVCRILLGDTTLIACPDGWTTTS